MASKTDSKLISLATGKKNIAKPEPVEVVEKENTPEEERDLKAKKTVENLLKDVSLTPKKEEAEEEIFEIDNKKVENIEWLQEQLGLVTSENDLLKSDLLAAKDDYAKLLTENQRIKNGASIQDDGVLKSTVTKLFHELQSNYISMGKNMYTGEPNFRIVPGAFLNRLIVYFPFLQKEKKF
jgi:hypothetical protein